DPVSITYDNAGTTVELAIHIVVVKVTFRKHPDQVYGFDDNPAFEKPNNTTFCYPSYNTSPPKNGVPWKSIKVGKSDLVVAEVLPEGAGGKVFFESDSQEFSVLTGVVSTSEVSFSIQTGTQSAEGLITAAVGQENGPAAGWLRVVNFQEEMKTVILIEVYDGNLDPAVHALLPTQEEIEMEVKKLYRGGVINLDISFSLLENLKYDVANYNEIEVPDDGNYSPEMNSIFQKCNSCQTLNQQSTPIWFIFIVDLPTVQNGIPYDIQGRNKLGLNYGFVFLKNHSEKSISNTIAHELGHGIFSIKHPFIEFNPGNETTCNSNYSTIGLDQFNIMDYSDEVSLLFREYCWSKMHQP
nr:hypothetical protein [Ignavibacteria bacterium]